MSAIYRVLSIKNTSELLNVSKDTIRRMTWRGELVGCRVGKRGVRICINSISRYRQKFNPSESLFVEVQSLNSIFFTSRLLQIRTVAVALDVSERTVFRLIKDKELVAGKIGSSLRISPEALELYIQNGIRIYELDEGFAIPESYDRSRQKEPSELTLSG